MKLRNRLALVVAPLATVSAIPSHAALDAAVTTAISDAQADIVTASGLIIAMAAVAMGLRWIKGTFF